MFYSKKLSNTDIEKEIQNIKTKWENWDGVMNKDFISLTRFNTDAISFITDIKIKCHFDICDINN